MSAQFLLAAGLAALSALWFLKGALGDLFAKGDCDSGCGSCAKGCPFQAPLRGPGRS